MSGTDLHLDCSDYGRGQKELVRRLEFTLGFEVSGEGWGILEWVLRSVSKFKLGFRMGS